ncbi:hypothetical protein C9426_10585, partial [Serratia sp. S1B]
MNSKFFKSVWNASLGNYVAVAENAKNHVDCQSVSTPSLPGEGSQTILSKRFPLRASVVVMSCVLNFFSYSALAAPCTGSGGGGQIGVNTPGTNCSLADGRYAGNQAIQVENGSTVTNDGTLDLFINSNSIGRGVRVITGGLALLNNVNVTGGTSGGQMYGLHASLGTISLTGDYSFTGTGNGAIGAVSGEQPSARGTLTIEGNTDISILGGNNTLGLVSRSTGGSVLTTQGDVTIANAGTNGYGVNVIDSAIMNLNGQNNTITMTGGTSFGLSVKNSATLSILHDVNVTATGVNNNGVNASGGTLTIGGNLSSHSTGTSITAIGGAKVSVAGQTTASTTQDNAYGVYASGANSAITLADANITTNGVGSHGVYATVNGSVNLNGTGTTSITVNGNASSSSETNGVYVAGNGHITTAAGTVLNIVMNGNANGTNRTYGVHATGAVAFITLNGTTNITTTGFNGFGLRGDGGGTVISNGNLNITTAQGPGVQSTDAGTTVTLAGAQNSINVSAQNGSITNGILVSNGARLNINSTNTTIETHGTNAYGIHLGSMSGANVNLNGAVSIETFGPTSHGFYLTAGSTYTFDGAANHQMPTFVIHGQDSAALDANDNGSLFTLTNNAALNMSMTPVAGTWGAKAETAGRVRFQGDSSTGGTGLWASNNGTIDLWGNADAAGSRVRLDTNSTLNLESTGTSTVSIGSLEGLAGNTVNLYGHTLSIGANNSGNNGSLINEANFAGSFGNAGSGSLLKTGDTTQILSGLNNTVASVLVNGGTLSFQQVGAFNTSGNYTTANGGTTDIGQELSTLNVGGIFTQQNGSALSVTIGATPDITADTAVLDGTLVVRGFDDGQPPAKASEVTTNNYTLIHTTNGITGDFINNPLDPLDLDYLLHEGHISADGKDYNLGFQLAWTEGGQAQGTGSFTLAQNTAFNLDQALTDQVGPFDSGWDGKSLTKNGEGLLVLSTVAQQYTGSTTVNGGTLQTDIADAFATSTAVVVNGGLLDLNGNNQTAHNLSGTGGEISLTSGAQLRVDNSIDTTYAGSITDSGSLLKVGDGMLTLTGDASHSGLTTVDAGTLSIGNGGTSGIISSDIANNTVLIFNRSDASDYAGVLSGEGDLFKQGAGELTLTGATSHQGSVQVQAGTLTLKQNGGSLTTTGDYTTSTGATTAIGLQSSTLNVGGVFTQQSGSVLNVTLGASPDITAQTAQLAGELVVNGFADTEDPARASGVVGQDYVMLHTTGGISDDFTNNPLNPYSLDYLLHDGHLSDDHLDYTLGFRLAWTEGEQQYSTGNFTLNADTAFNVDIALENQTLPAGGFATGWDGQSLMKDGAGRLVLSKVNGYTGSTTVENGTLQLDVADSIKTSSEVIVNGGIVNLNGNDQQFNRLSGNGGEVQLNGATLTAVNADSTVNSDYAGAITGNGTLVKDGSGSLTLSGNTAWVGDTELQGGSLILD